MSFPHVSGENQPFEDDENVQNTLLFYTLLSISISTYYTFIRKIIEKVSKILKNFFIADFVDLCLIYTPLVW